MINFAFQFDFFAFLELLPGDVAVGRVVVELGLLADDE